MSNSTKQESLVKHNYFKDAITTVATILLAVTLIYTIVMGIFVAKWNPFDAEGKLQPIFMWGGRPQWCGRFNAIQLLFAGAAMALSIWRDKFDEKIRAEGLKVLRVTSILVTFLAVCVAVLGFLSTFVVPNQFQVWRKAMFFVMGIGNIIAVLSIEIPRFLMGIRELKKAKEVVPEV